MFIPFLIKHCLLNLELAKAQTGLVFGRIFRGDKLIIEDSRANFNYVFIDLSNVKLLFKKIKSLLVQCFYLNFVKKVKCILNRKEIVRKLYNCLLINLIVKNF